MHMHLVNDDAARDIVRVVLLNIPQSRVGEEMGGRGGVEEEEEEEGR
jgi:hypothetical protein